jgi:Protein of unknown function (DUF2782)
MRLTIFLLLSSLSLNTFAVHLQPIDLHPVPEASVTYDNSDEVDETEIVITTKQARMIEEFRVANQLYMIKVTPRIGAPYYLVDSLGDGKFARQNSLDSGFRPPRWTIKKF